ncbi:MAG: ABC transporter permease [Synergistaceae bacterium]|jgi:peptide/nickel transport system permease protein|nr:ABC transporter permease [Synergistaceae bacterium]
MSRTVYVARKAGQLFATLFFIAAFNFCLFRILPGSPLTLLARKGNLSADVVARLTSLFGLDKPLWQQFLIYLQNLATAEFGISMTFRRRVIDVISERLVNSFMLLALASVFVIAIGISCGIVAAMRRGTALDRTIVVSSMAGWSFPTFWTGLIAIIVFGTYLHMFPISGIVTPGMRYATSWAETVDILRHLFLPTLTLIIVDTAQFSLVTRSALVDVFTEDYILTARAKGLSENQVLSRHAMPNAMLPIMTTTALYVSLLIGGAIEVETVFSFPGMGKLMYDSVLLRDYPILEASFFLFAAFTVFANFVTDVMYMIVDPRVKSL